MTLDEFVVELNLDTSNFTEGQRKALDAFSKTQEELERRLKRLEEESKNTGYAFGGMTNAAQGLFTTLTGVGMASFARDAANSATAMGKTAFAIGTTTSEVHALSRAIEGNGDSADSAMASMAGLANTLERVRRWGDISPDFAKGLQTIGADLRNDDPMSLFWKLARFSDTDQSPGKQETRIAGQRLGMDIGLINEALRGSAKAAEDFNRAMRTAMTPEQAAKLDAMRRSWTWLGQEISSVGIDVEAKVAPAFTILFNGLAHWIHTNKDVADSLGAILAAFVALETAAGASKLLGLFGMWRLAGVAGALPSLAGKAITGGGIIGLALAMMEGTKLDDANGNPVRTAIRSALGIDDPHEPGEGVRTPFVSAAAREAYIRRSAIRYGIDPDIAMRVARAEGFDHFSGDENSSFGAFQLHYGGISRKNWSAGLGDEFTKATGLDARDPANETAGIDFALAKVAQMHSWRLFHGAAAAKVGDSEGITVNGGITVVLPNAKDAKGFARDLPGALSGKNIAMSANSGQRP